MIKMIEDDPDATWSLGGDTTDSMNSQDDRYKMGQYEGHAERTDAQIDIAVKFLEPIKDKLLWVLMGNHEYRVWNTTDVAKRLARRLGCDCYEDLDNPDPNISSVMQMKVNMGAYTVLDGHWEWYVNSMANDDYIAWENERRSLKKRMCKVGGVDDCDAVVCHHIHKVHAIPPTTEKFMKTVTDKDGKLRAVYAKPTKIWINEKKGLFYYTRDDRWYGSSGGFMPSYVEGFSTYAERKGYKPTEMGCVKGIVRNGKFLGLEEVKL
jgi:hypothetical protein